jgi:hypothetical protein
LIAGAFAPLARVWNWPYLETMARPVSAANGTLSAPSPRARAATVIVWSAAALGALAVLAAAVLWIYYGTAVFFEMIAAGIAACF